MQHSLLWKMTWQNGMTPSALSDMYSTKNFQYRQSNHNSHKTLRNRFTIVLHVSAFQNHNKKHKKRRERSSDFDQTRKNIDNRNKNRNKSYNPTPKIPCLCLKPFFLFLNSVNTCLKSLPQMVWPLQANWKMHTSLKLQVLCHLIWLIKHTFLKLFLTRKTLSYRVPISKRIWGCYNFCPCSSGAHQPTQCTFHSPWTLHSSSQFTRLAGLVVYSPSLSPPQSHSRHPQDLP